MKKIKNLVAISTLVLFSGCIKEVKDTIDSIECATLISKIDNDDNNDSCEDIIADIKKIERSCGEFLTEDTKELIATIRANCTDD